MDLIRASLEVSLEVEQFLEVPQERRKTELVAEVTPSSLSDNSLLSEELNKLREFS
jgi:hypothetical protein